MPRRLPVQSSWRAAAPLLSPHTSPRAFSFLHMFHAPQIARGELPDWLSTLPPELSQFSTCSMPRRLAAASCLTGCSPPSSATACRTPTPARWVPWCCMMCVCSLPCSCCGWGVAALWLNAPSSWLCGASCGIAWQMTNTMHPMLVSAALQDAGRQSRQVKLLCACVGLALQHQPASLAEALPELQSFCIQVRAGEGGCAAGDGQRNAPHAVVAPLLLGGTRLTGGALAARPHPGAAIAVQAGRRPVQAAARPGPIEPRRVQRVFRFWRRQQPRRIGHGLGPCSPY